MRAALPGQACCSTSGRGSCSLWPTTTTRHRSPRCCGPRHVVAAASGSTSTTRRAVPLGSSLLGGAVRHHHHHHHHHHTRRCVAASATGEGGQGEEGSSSSTTTTTKQKEEAGSRIGKTLAGLDALLGVEEEPPKKAEQPSSSSASSTSNGAEAMQKLQADAAAGASTSGGAAGSEIDGQFQKIIEKAKRLAEEQAKSGDGSSSNAAEQQQLKAEFDMLLQKISKAPEAMSREELKRLKDAAFGPQTFWVTATEPIVEVGRSGMLIRGNLRDERSKVYAHVCDKVQELFGDKFCVLMLEDPLASEEDAAKGPGTLAAGGAPSQAVLLNTPRVAFQIVPAAQAVPPQTTGWGRAVAFLLAVLFVGSCGQLALAANVTKLPKETLEWFANPANFETDALPPGLENWDPASYFANALPIFSAVLGTNVAHEMGHRVAAFVRSVRLGPTIFVPNFQIGSFGGITPFTSMLKDRMTLWDVSSAGPLSGAAVSALVLLVGLAQSQAGTDPASVSDMLVPVPTQLFQGSLLLGSIARAALGDQALRGATVLVSPLVIAGWCGLVTQALQLLPVGSVDGGRMVQAAFGRQALSLSSFFIYVGLGLGLLGSSLALPYGLYVLICQRVAEQYVKDSVTPPGGPRATITIVAVLTALLILLPMAPELASDFGVGPVDPFF